MDKQKIENKFIYFISLLGMVMILVLIAYFFFLRNVEVDIMDNAQYTLSLIHISEPTRRS